MHYYEFATEARRNPEKNPREEWGHPGALKYLEQYRLLHGAEALNSVGISMTDIDKLGINPQSDYNTPIGVYFYPAEYYIHLKSKGEALDFKDDAPYIQIFEFPQPALQIDTMSDDDYQYYINFMREMIDSPSGLSDIYRTIRSTEAPKWSKWSANSLTKLLDQFDAQSHQGALVNSSGGRFWYVLYKLSNALKVSGNNPAVLWNRLIRELGIATIVDNGARIIHENEPTQGVVLKTSAVKLLKSFQNYKREGNILHAGHTPKDWIDAYHNKKITQRELISASTKWIKKYGSAINVLNLSWTVNRRLPDLEYLFHVVPGDGDYETPEDKYNALLGNSLNYAKRLLVGRGWASVAQPENEQLFADDDSGSFAYDYATQVLQRRFPAGEHAILANISLALKYAEEFNISPTKLSSQVISINMNYPENREKLIRMTMQDQGLDKNAALQWLVNRANSKSK
jgi:hypothetical protein